MLFMYAMKKLLNFQEALTNRRLKSVCEHNGALVFAKVRLADVLPIEESGISTDLYRFALKSHFDFVVTDSKHMPLLSVEFDGSLHNTVEQRERDSKKDKLCVHFGFPLLRINSRYLEAKYRSLDLLTWIVEKWFTPSNKFKWLRRRDSCRRTTISILL